ncbi:MAG: ribosome biogenesis GTP-binding protein YihA/YsxC [Rhodospirillaceae bacterium]
MVAADPSDPSTELGGSDGLSETGLGAEVEAEADAEAAARIEAGRKLFAGPCDFVMGCVRMDHLPNSPLTEICFAGRSNVGKSSLINALTGRKTLARASVTPGRTQELNFFRLARSEADPHGLMLADLPGYGYAKAPKAKVKAWTNLVMDYLRGRPTLRRVCLLIDSRHGPKANDVEVMKMLDQAAVSYQLILTKADKPKPADLAKSERATAAAIAARVAAHPDYVLTSSQTGAGIAELRAALAQLAVT